MTELLSTNNIGVLPVADYIIECYFILIVD